jgi:hypothetical protein
MSAKDESRTRTGVTLLEPESSKNAGNIGKTAGEGGLEASENISASPDIRATAREFTPPPCRTCHGNGGSFTYPGRSWLACGDCRGSGLAGVRPIAIEAQPPTTAHDGPEGVACDPGPVATTQSSLDAIKRAYARVVRPTAASHYSSDPLLAAIKRKRVKP